MVPRAERAREGARETSAGFSRLLCQHTIRNEPHKCSAPLSLSNSRSPERERERNGEASNVATTRPPESTDLSLSPSLSRVPGSATNKRPGSTDFALRTHTRFHSACLCVLNAHQVNKKKSGVNKKRRIPRRFFQNNLTERFHVRRILRQAPRNLILDNEKKISSRCQKEMVRAILHAEFVPTIKIREDPTAGRAFYYYSSKFRLV